jgi:hypothetical protein
LGPGGKKARFSPWATHFNKKLIFTLTSQTKFVKFVKFLSQKVKSLLIDLDKETA